MYNHETFRKLCPTLIQFPEDAYFDVYSRSLDIQAHTQAEATVIRRFFPGTTWKKEWNAECKWWEYHTDHDGIHIKIYAVTEGPKTCTAITETRTVTKRVPVTFKDETTEETVIVGWDCTDNQEVATNAPE